MAITEPLCLLLGITPSKFTKTENILIEIDLFTRLCKRLKEVFTEQYRNYFDTMKFTKEMENIMLDSSFIRLIINDILATGEYTIEGIAYYTNTHEDVLHELVTGLNTEPSASCLRNTMELHRIVRSELYKELGRKIALEFIVARK